MIVYVMLAWLMAMADAPRWLWVLWGFGLLFKLLEIVVETKE